jgi:SNF2 family DNA or RNA helicase
MIVLHGGWLPHTKRRAGSFFIWGEDSGAPPSRRRGRPPRVKPHPFQASAKHLLDALEVLAEGRDLGPVPEQPDPMQVQAFLPSSEREPLASPALVRDTSDEEAAEFVPQLRPWTLEGLALSPLDALALLVSLPQSAWSPLMAVLVYTLGQDLQYWSAAAKFALEFLAGQRFLPALAQDEAGGFRAVWIPAPDDDRDQQRLGQLIQAMPPVCRGLGVKAAEEAGSPWMLMRDFLEEVVETCVRQWMEPLPRRRGRRSAQAASRWAEALLAADPMVDAPASQLSALYDQWQAWLESLRTPTDAPFRICFRLEPPAPPDAESIQAEPVEAETVDAESAEAWTLRFFLQATDDPSLLVPAQRVWRERGSTLRFLNRHFDQPQERLLAGLGLASRLFPPLERGLRSVRPEDSRLTVQEVHAFLRETAPLLEQSGFGVLVPPWWNKRGARLGVRARVSSRGTSESTGRGILSMDSIVQYNWQLALGDEELSWEEFNKLAALKTPLIQLRGQWVELDPAQVEAAIRFWEERREQEEMRLRDALRMGLGQEGMVEGLPVTGVDAEGWVADLLRQLRDGQQLAQLPQPGEFVGQLRPYQIRGFSWLAFLRRWGLGACLADDMGLGKTIQAIALLLYDRERGVLDRPVLLICPTSVVGNWHRELGRFSPGLRVLVHHGSDRATGEEFIALAGEHDVIISTYALARRDEETLWAVEWGGVILDEAQNIKNPSTKRAQAIRKLQAEYRVALTGTPVENRLSELWSIMEFLNPGYLGSQKGFRSRFARPIERYQEEGAAKQLQSLVQPFVLRRLKTDSHIIQDLPEKMEMMVYCTLVPEQATLYEAVVRDSLEQVEESEGIRRRGVVLATLLKLKQVCNHPAQFLGDGSALPGRSGKLARLTEMLEEVLSVGEKALVFTQFAEMGKMLKAHLQEAFGREVLFLHGGTPQKQRDRMVTRFQEEGHGPPIFVLSLKAGGLGLNLTGANHVFHFDRWWNPAVENQATDRAFRIGQTRDVLVHKFICAGTLEERIDDLIESKKELAEMVIGAGEGWLTELSTDELRDLMTLQGKAVGK